jgi:hypothetical protein
MMQRKLPHGLKVYLPLVLMLVFFVFMLPRSPRFRYEYKKGEHWKYETLTADFAFPLLKTDDQLRAERNDHMYKTPYFKKVNAAKDSALARFDRMPMDGLSDGLKDTLRSTLVSVYAKGIFAVKDQEQKKQALVVRVLCIALASLMVLGSVYAIISALI